MNSVFDPTCLSPTTIVLYVIKRPHLDRLRRVQTFIVSVVDKRLGVHVDQSEGPRGLGITRSTDHQKTFIHPDQILSGEFPLLICNVSTSVQTRSLLVHIHPFYVVPSLTRPTQILEMKLVPNHKS